MKDHEKRELVDRMTAVARLYANTGQLRDRVRAELQTVFDKMDRLERRRDERVHDEQPRQRTEN